MKDGALRMKPWHHCQSRRTDITAAVPPQKTVCQSVVRGKAAKTREAGWAVEQHRPQKAARVAVNSEGAAPGIAIQPLQPLGFL